MCMAFISGLMWWPILIIIHLKKKWKGAALLILQSFLQTDISCWQSFTLSALTISFGNYLKMGPGEYIFFLRFLNTFSSLVTCPLQHPLSFSRPCSELCEFCGRQLPPGTTLRGFPWGRQCPAANQKVAAPTRDQLQQLQRPRCQVVRLPHAKALWHPPRTAWKLLVSHQNIKVQRTLNGSINAVYRQNKSRRGERLRKRKRKF